MAKFTPDLLLIDGNSYLYRAFHAIGDMKNKIGQPTGAIFGMTKMLHNTINQFPTRHICCVFDAKGPTFREELYPQYKAQRPSMPDDLRLQLDAVKQFIGILGIPMLEQSGVEADDVIASLAKVATEKEGKNVLISTGDKDFAQLVNDKIHLINTMTQSYLDEAGIIEKFGLKPVQIIDYLTLMGDTVDNVPGIPKVGPKTAVKWLQQYGTLDTLIEHCNEISGVVGQNLRSHLDWLPLGKQLITIKQDCEVPDWHELKRQPVDAEAFASFCRLYDFYSLLKDIELYTSVPVIKNNVNATSNISSQNINPTNYTEIKNLSEFTEILIELKKLPENQAVSLFCLPKNVDDFNHWPTNTIKTSIVPELNELAGISLSWQENQAVYISFNNNPLWLESVFPYLTEVLEEKNCNNKNPVYTLDAKILPDVLQFQSDNNKDIHDILLMQYVLNSHFGQLKQFPVMVFQQLHQNLDINDKTVKDIDTKLSTQSTESLYLIGKITDFIRQMGVEFHQILRTEKNKELLYIYEKIEKPLQNILKSMENQGIMLDLAILTDLQKDIEKRLLQLTQSIFELTPHVFNLNSPKQLGEMLFETLKMPILKKTPTGTPSTDESVLEELSLDFPIAKYLMEYRRLTKLQNTYIEKLPLMVDENKRLHTSFGQTTAVTGRLTSLTPNLQNIPVKTKEGQMIRSSFIAKAGHVLLSADYSQIELRILAHLSQDAYLIDAFLKDLDIHSATAAHLFHQGNLELVQSHERRYAKAINFGLIYGMSAFGLSQELGVSSSEAKIFMEQYFNQYPKVLSFMESLKDFAKQHGYVQTILGRKIHVPDINSSKHVLKQGAQRAAINAPMQGSSSDLIKLAMVQLIKEKPEFEKYLLLQVHDELIFEVPQALASELTLLIQHVMENVYPLTVPLKVSIKEGSNWEQAH